MEQFIKKFDIFTIKSELRFKKKANHQTFLGGILTMFLFILMLLSLISFGTEVIVKEQPETNVGDHYDINPKLHEIDNQEFGLAFGLQNKYAKHFIDDQIYNLKVFQKLNYKIKQEDGTIKTHYTRKEIPIEICSKENFPKKFHFYFLKLNYNSLYCIAKNHSKYFIQGTFDNEIFQSLRIQIYSCKRLNCKNKTIIDNLLFAGYFSMYYIDKTVNPGSLKQPFKEYPTDFFTSISNSVRKNTFFHFKRVNIVSDTGFLLEKKESFEGVIVKNYIEQYVFFKNPKNIFNLEIRFDNIITVYNRKYKKVQDVLAQVGGIFKVNNLKIYIYCSLFFFEIYFDYFKTLISNLNLKF